MSKLHRYNKHDDSIDDLLHRIVALAMIELRAALQGKSGVGAIGALFMLVHSYIATSGLGFIG